MKIPTEVQLPLKNRIVHYQQRQQQHRATFRPLLLNIEMREMLCLSSWPFIRLFVRLLFVAAAAAASKQSHEAYVIDSLVAAHELVLLIVVQ